MRWTLLTVVIHSCYWAGSTRRQISVPGGVDAQGVSMLGDGRLYGWTGPWVTHGNRRRFSVELPVTLKANPHDEPDAGMVVDLSAGGLFVAHCSLPFPVGTTLRVSLVLPLATGPRPLVATARVRWMNDPSRGPAPERPAGMGLAFLTLEPLDRAALHAFLEELFVRSPTDR